LCALKPKIFGINVLELSRLIDKTTVAKKKIENRDVILIIGNTGSGKSTNVLRFLGYNLQPGKVGNLKTLLPTKELQKEHKTFYTSPETKSCTRYINAVPVPAEMYMKNTPERKKTFVICDSPGFGDSAGV
jgi:predicted GTPase